MPDVIYKYRLDLTGQHPDNRITENKTIGSSVMRIFAPEGGPFFGNNVVIKEKNTGRLLEPMLDYKLLHNYREAQEAASQPIYCAIYIHNKDIDVEIEYTVSYIGGEFSFTRGAIVEILNTLQADDRVIEWGQLIGVPDGFAPSRHIHTAYDLIGQKHLVAANSEIAKAIREGQIIGQDMLFDMLDTRLDLLRTIPGRLSAAFLRGTQRIETLLI